MSHDPSRDPALSYSGRVGLGDDPTPGRGGSASMVRQGPDAAWESDLLTFLAALESVRVKLEGDEARADAEVALAVFDELVSKSSAFAEENLAGEQPEEMGRQLALTGDFFTALGQARALLRRERSWLNWFRKRPDPTILISLTREVNVLLLDVLAGYFSLLACRFSSMKLAQRWKDTASVFLADVKATLG